jgi:hypothetical protein
MDLRACLLEESPSGACLLPTGHGTPWTLDPSHYCASRRVILLRRLPGWILTTATLPTGFRHIRPISLQGQHRQPLEDLCSTCHWTHRTAISTCPDPRKPMDFCPSLRPCLGFSTKLRKASLYSSHRQTVCPLSSKGRKDSHSTWPVSIQVLHFVFGHNASFSASTLEFPTTTCRQWMPFARNCLRF